MICKIVSGGQTGADQGALDAAIEYCFPYGGWIPKGRLTENGPLPDTYRLQEMPTKDYKKRTLQNVLDSDATLIVSRGKVIGGTKLTMDYANKHGKNSKHVNLQEDFPLFVVPGVYSWIHQNCIKVLNVAGPRASKDAGIYDDVKLIITGVLLLTAVDAPPGSKLADYTQEQYMEKLPFKPHSVEDAVSQLTGQLSLEARVSLARMKPEDFVKRFAQLFPQFKRSFGEWLDSPELIASCNEKSPDPITDSSDAAAVVIATLWKQLQVTHGLRVVK